MLVTEIISIWDVDTHFITPRPFLVSRNMQKVSKPKVVSAIFYRAVQKGSWGAHVFFVCRVCTYRKVLLGNKGRAKFERIRISYSGYEEDVSLWSKK